MVGRPEGLRYSKAALGGCATRRQPSRAALLVGGIQAPRTTRSAGLQACGGSRHMDPRTELVDVIRRVRNRWRMRLALRGAVVVAAGTVLALLLSASGLESFRFSAPAI